MTENILELKNVGKAFSGFALDDVTFTLPKGYVMGLIGANGAGKTTTMRLILNMLKKEKGDIRIFGKDHVEAEKEIKENIGAVFDNSFFVDSWTVEDTEKAVSMFFKNWNHAQFQNHIQRFELPKKKKIRDFSRGMQMKLMLSCALSHDARLLLLDEPTSGLDPVTRSELLEILQEYIQDGEHSVLFSTHITTDLEKIADYITFLKHGKPFYTGTTENFIQSYRVIKGDPNILTPDLKKNIFGLRVTDMGFDGLISVEHVKKYANCVSEIPTIDDIVVYTSKKEAAPCKAF